MAPDTLPCELGFHMRPEGRMLRLIDARTGRPIPTRLERAERAEAEEFRANAEHERAESERKRAEDLAAEVERLRAQLSRTGP